MLRSACSDVKAAVWTTVVNVAAAVVMATFLVLVLTSEVIRAVEGARRAVWTWVVRFGFLLGLWIVLVASLWVATILSVGLVMQLNADADHTLLRHDDPVRRIPKEVCLVLTAMVALASLVISVITTFDAVRLQCII
jgi:hypothetical protein